MCEGYAFSIDMYALTGKPNIIVFDGVETRCIASLQTQRDWTMWRRCTQRLYKRNVFGRGGDAARHVSTNAM